MIRLISLSCIGLLCSVSNLSGAILMFEDTSSNVSLPANYAGFNWTPNFVARADGYLTTYYGQTYNSPSGIMQISNQGTNENFVALSSLADFDFNSAYVMGWGANGGYASYTATSLTVEGYNNGALVGSVSMNLSATQYQLLTANFDNIDELRFIASGPLNEYRWWLMDDFTFNEPISSSVPEPGTLIMFGLGGLGLAFGALRRRFRKAV